MKRPLQRRLHQEEDGESRHEVGECGKGQQAPCFPRGTDPPPENGGRHHTRREDAGDERAETSVERCGRERCTAGCVLPRIRQKLYSPEEVHQKQGRLRDRRRSSALRFGFPKAPCKGMRPKRREADGELAPIETPVEISLPPAHAPGSGTAPKGAEAQEAVGIEAGEAVNVRPLRAPQEPTKDWKDVQETSGHAKFRPWCRACLAGAGRD